MTLALTDVLPLPAFAPGDDHAVTGTLTTEVVPGETLRTESAWTGALAGSSRFELVAMTELDAAGAKVSAFHGRLVLLTARGDLVGEDRGLWNLATGAYIDLYTVTSGTGDYAGAHGAIVLTGTLDPASGHGDSRYAGVIARR